MTNLMKCGHVATALRAGQKACLICFGIGAGEFEEVSRPPGLEGRSAACTYCGEKIASDYKLPFFKHNTQTDFDEFYCGCRGWE